MKLKPITPSLVSIFTDRYYQAQNFGLITDKLAT